MTDSEGGKSRGEEVIALFARGAEFTRELLQENERLRKEMLELRRAQEHAALDPEEWSRLRLELVNRISSLEQEYASVRDRLEEVEDENNHFAERYIEIEEENNNLANLYVASYQLHSTLDLHEVLTIIVEIAINLIGAESFGIYMLDDATGELGLVASEGSEASELPRVQIGRDSQTAMAEALRREEPLLSEVGLPGDPSQPLACIPLFVEGNAIGVISIIRLLDQKEGFSDLDRELFGLLGGHAATAIFASNLYTRSERKLCTMRGVVGLLKD